MKTKRLLAMLILLTVALVPLQALGEEAVLYQVSTLQALMQGDYAGAVTVEELLQQGDTGLGTFDGLDGEMIVLDGVAYKAAYDGSVTIADAMETVPFANVAFLSAWESIDTSFEGGYEALLAALTASVPDQNMPVVFRITGSFTGVSVRSVPKQQEPYPLLAEVVKNQAVFTADQVDGTIVGFRFPAYMDDINVSGYHLHFLCADTTFGGHLLDMESGEITIQYCELNAFSMILPESIKLYTLTDTTTDDIKAVESL
ncbi:MAG TPA: acetolactate decarboxylase [Candidatus Limiplasma sp.]|nr:acetolactate decarboxylase [Candidatus Limiplasma sp.]